MTFREKLKQRHPALVSDEYGGGCYGCPKRYGFEAHKPNFCRPNNGDLCRKCWDREIPEAVPSVKEDQRAGDLRPCEVDGQRCYFHRFIEQELGWLQFNDEIVLGTKTVDMILDDFHERGIIANCCSMEKLRHAYALVEFPDGTVKKVEPEKVRFLDREG